MLQGYVRGVLAEESYADCHGDVGQLDVVLAELAIQLRLVVFVVPHPSPSHDEGLYPDVWGIAGGVVVRESVNQVLDVEVVVLPMLVQVYVRTQQLCIVDVYAAVCE